MQKRATKVKQQNVESVDCNRLFHALAIAAETAEDLAIDRQDVLTASAIRIVTEMRRSSVDAYPILMRITGLMRVARHKRIAPFSRTNEISVHLVQAAAIAPCSALSGFNVKELARLAHSFSHSPTQGGAA